MPGQFGPMSLDLTCDFRACLIYIMSCWGIPSVMATMRPISASIASRIAYLQPKAGTNITVASQPVSLLASKQSLKTGTPRWTPPKFLGLTPPTILVPYSIAVCVWKVPCLPVRPWTSTLVSLLIKNLLTTPNIL